MTAHQGGQGEPGGPLLGAGILRVPETSQQGPLGRDDRLCRAGLQGPALSTEAPSPGGLRVRLSSPRPQAPGLPATFLRSPGSHSRGAPTLGTCTLSMDALDGSSIP